MDKFLEIVGAIGVCLVLLVLIVLIFSTRGGPDAALALVAALPWAFPAIVGFVIIAAFGNMLGQLKAIREASERQASMFAEIMAGRKRAD
ncbi:hypothetical protein EXN32_25200 [Agrobacterium tumefaciens]|uniref:hypothetical protein n=1 Tax=Agrobacterium TaxID=357 RepID=UPI00115ECA5A|nr:MULTISPECIES: hypothetical protein [Agrobacterium]MDA5240622.1 hypothetical protein [Agrobacterium sp. MAFF310724]MDA5250181.1 hypothetical protein [Agrobacterium sp. MAFF210268]TRB10125.1 hypothetical protein EXN32_25200 [Agrobacterium tumefaciens]